MTKKNHAEIKTESFYGKKLLVIDDTAFSRLLPGMILRPFGVDVHEFSGVEEAISAVSNLTFDVVLLDLSMPGIDGKESLLMLKKCFTLHTPRIYAYTAYPREIDVSELKIFGFSDALFKPVKNRDLLNLFI